MSCIHRAMSTLNSGIHGASFVLQSFYSSFVYSDLCLQIPPNLYTSSGMGASTAQHAANTVKPQPYPMASVSGAVASGKNVPIKHLEISTAVRLEAEYKPNASTTYAMSGTIGRMMEKPRSTTARSMSGTGRTSSAAHP